MPILNAPKGITQPQVARLYAIARQFFVSSDEVRELLAQMGYEDPRDLTREDYDALCDVTLPSMDPPTEGRAVDPQTGEVYEAGDLDDWEAA